MQGIGRKKWAILVAAACFFGTAAAAPANDASTNASELQGDTIEYDAKTGQMTANGHVVLKSDGGVAKGSFATYNTNSKQGRITGNVVADRGTSHLTCNEVQVLSETQIVAIGNVHGKEADKTFVGPRAEYTSDTGYVRMPQGGTITSKDGSFTANFMEGWMKENHFKGVGATHVISEVRRFEGGGDEAEYFGADSGKLILTGNAWGIQENNTMKSKRLTVYLNETGKAQAKPAKDE